MDKMNSIENYFSKYKTAFIFFIVIILPLVLIWCLIYGVIIGIIGITVDRYETLRKIIKRDGVESAKYPKWKDEKYKKLYLGGVDDMTERQKVKEDFESGRRKPLGLVGSIITDILLFGFFFYPFLLIWGILTGPIRAFLDYFKWCYKIWNGYSTYKGGWN